MLCSRPQQYALASLPLAVALACSSGCATQKVVGLPSFAAKTTLKLAAERCEGLKCRCVPLQATGVAKEKGIPEGHKRFELRIPRSTAALWVELEGTGVYYKPPTTVLPQCLYVDLKPGRHRFTVYGERRDLEVGLQLGLTMREYGEPKDGGPSWYRSFHMTCGIGASPCAKDELAIWRAFVRKLPRGVLDPCGSVMLKGATFGGTRAQKGDDQYQKAVVRFGLKVYGFAPHRPPNSPKCKKPSKNR